MSTLVIQSHASPLRLSWLKTCAETVRSWCQINQFDYQWLDDQLFDLIDESILKKVGETRVIATDLARLYALKRGLETHERVIWLDVDFLIFAPQSFQIPTAIDTSGYRVGREVWVQNDKTLPGKLKVYVKVHNAFLMFDRQNSFLDFYLSHAEKLVHECDGPMPPQFIGPKLLTAIHNMVGCPVMETAGMLSPLIIDDLLSEGPQRPALNLMQERSREPLAGANLCHSLAYQHTKPEQRMEQLVDKLLTQGEQL